MAEATKIQWTDHTFNIAWGCTKVSAGCANCYADRDATRYGFRVWGPTAERRTFGEKHWNEPRKWNRQAEAEGRRHRVFCSSMCDVFEDHPTIDRERARLWPLIHQTPWLDWQLLTKRADRLREIFPYGGAAMVPNLWLGVSIEDQAAADERIPHLLATPAAVRFLSCEPLLGPVNLNRIHGCRDLVGGAREDWWESALNGKRFDIISGEDEPATRLDWVIVGGESGPGARRCEVAWIRSIVAQCKAAKTACFVKQVGANPWLEPGELDARRARPGYVPLHDRKGGKPEEWPEDLRVRQFPEVIHA